MYNYKSMYVVLTKEYLDEACSDQLSSVSSLSFQTTHSLIDQYPSVIINWTKIKNIDYTGQCKICNKIHHLHNTLTDIWELKMSSEMCTQL